ncbi:hypothetical protein HHK36_031898 [Tetracentron sinense]|uniref:Peptidase metallopeptidase domain-containing protein n=1 Tax=Tetracentron sinense TaxID=13715 RepID=A0A835D0X7_TETSI|nr:hypothetical protein HHK36_031898 [Tetracentron sinense]
MAPRSVSPLWGAFLLLVILPHTILCITSEVKGEKSSQGQPFKFLLHLEGSHKGQTVLGLHELKQYLKNFGYLDYNVKLAHSKSDEFDELLESAIKTYQLNYHLKATGTLDSQTVKQMMMPRCGFPDITNDTTSMRSGMKKHRHDPTSIRTVSHYSYMNGRKWPASKTDLTYAFSSSVSLTDDDMDIVRYVNSQAFASWAAVSHFTFEEAQDISSADMVIGFHSRSHGDGYPFDGPKGVLAHAFAPTDGRFHFDADENWGTDPSPGVIDLESVAVHEIGHLLGLGHSTVRAAVMYPSISPGVARRQLQRDDIQGIRTLYQSS